MKQFFLCCLLLTGSFAKAQPYYTVQTGSPICGSYTVQTWVMDIGTCNAYQLVDVIFSGTTSLLDLSLASSWASGVVPSCSCTYELAYSIITNDCVPTTSGTGPNGFPYDQITIGNANYGCFPSLPPGGAIDRSCPLCGPPVADVTQITYLNVATPNMVVQFN